MALPRAVLAQPPSKEPKEKPFALSLSPEFTAGTAIRLNEPATGYPLHERLAITYQLGLYLGLHQRADVGVHYFHAGIGTEKTTDVGVSTGIHTRRTLDGAMLEGRFFALRNSWATLFLGLQIGLGWQRAEHTVTRVEQPESSPVFTRGRCDVRGGAGLGMGASLGGEFDLGSGASFLVLASGTTNRLSSDPLPDDNSSCVDGAGTVHLFLGHIGFRYRFDLRGESKK
ncbi:MAG: hypothetical protein RMJ98_12200 [Myxococcales bacterium]|nr:hypothetical protein [Polyangiaceae bacterium]MDW8250049.1 hypothetical protein [Myxococcales bacterium]